MDERELDRWSFDSWWAEKEREEEEEEESHEGQFYCGICGWSDISTFPHSH